MFNPNWGEQASFNPDNILRIDMSTQGLTQEQAAAIWRPFFDAVAAAPQDYRMLSPPLYVIGPAHLYWDAATLRTEPGRVIADDRPDASASNVFWTGNLGETGHFIYGFRSTWLPAILLRKEQQPRLADALFVSSRQWQVGLHFNKGLAGARKDDIAAARATATNPAVLDAFTLVIIVANAPPAFAGIAGHEPDLVAAGQQNAAVERAFGVLRPLGSGSYISEGDFFDTNWQKSYWGSNYPRLRTVKKKYDPDGLFVAHNGVGSEDWSLDGFTRVAKT